MSESNDEISELPDVELLSALRPNNPTGGEIRHTYKELATTTRMHEQTLSRREREFWALPEGSIQEQQEGLKLAKAYLLLAALESNIDRPKEVQAIWAQRFTEMSAEIFGVPEPGHVQNLLAEDIELTKSLINVPGVSMYAEQLAEIYSKYGFEDLEIDKEWNENFEMRRQVAYGLIDLIVQERYGNILEKIDSMAIDNFSPEQAKEAIDMAFDLLRLEDQGMWEGWHGELKPTLGADTNVSKKAISINDKDYRLTGKLKGTIIHELHHALQGANGQKYGFPGSLPGGLEFKEGIAVLAAETVNGGNEGGRDHYINIGLAMGIGVGRRVARPDLARIAQLRSILRTKQNNPNAIIDEQATQTQAWRSVDRILRGTPASEEGNTGVYTKDVSYYGGYLKVIDYIYDEFSKGKSGDSIYDFLVSAVFDPTQPNQAEFVAQNSAKK